MGISWVLSFTVVDASPFAVTRSCSICHLYLLPYLVMCKVFDFTVHSWSNHLCMCVCVFVCV